MYVDREVAKIIRQMEAKKLIAVEEERFEYASKLKVAMENLRKAGERLGKYELEKKYAIALEDYDKAKAKKAQAQQYRQQVYQALEIHNLLEVHGVSSARDFFKLSLAIAKARLIIIIIKLINGAACREKQSVVRGGQRNDI